MEVALYGSRNEDKKKEKKKEKVSATSSFWSGST
jgi:hypothetical protein